MLCMSMNGNNNLLIEKLEDHNIPLDGLNTRGSVPSELKEVKKKTEESDFVKKFMKGSHK